MFTTISLVVYAITCACTYFFLRYHKSQVINMALWIQDTLPDVDVFFANERDSYNHLIFMLRESYVNTIRITQATNQIILNSIAFGILVFFLADLIDQSLIYLIPIFSIGITLVLAFTCFAALTVNAKLRGVCRGLQMMVEAKKSLPDQNIIDHESRT